MRGIVVEAEADTSSTGRALLCAALDLDEPSLTPGAAILRPLRAVLTADDLATAPGVIPGRRFVAELLDAQPEGPIDDAVLKRARASDRIYPRVTALPATFCGACQRCTRGLQTHCEARRELGTPGMPGGLAERIAVPVRCLAPVPHEVDDDAAAYASLLAEAFHATSLLHLEGKAFVTVIGDTPAGLLCAQLMARRNASVRLLGRDEARLAVCERWGVKHRPLEEAGRRGDQDVVVDATGGVWGFDAAIGMLRPRGQLLLLATPTPAVSHGGAVSADSPTLDAIAAKEITLIGARGGRLADALRALARDEADVVGLMSKRTTLRDAPAAARSLAEPGVISVLVA